MRSSVIRIGSTVLPALLGLSGEALAQPVSPVSSGSVPWMVIQQAERAGSDRERAGLRGPVAKVVEEQVSGPVALLIRGATRITTKIVEYDDRGAEVLREEYRTWNGDLLRRIEQDYDASGRVVNITEELWGATRTSDFFGHLGHAADASEVQEAVYRDFDGPTQTIHKQFRYEGDRLVEVEIADTAVGSEIDRRVYEYDVSGGQVKVYSSNGQGAYAPASVSQYRLQPNGALERTTTYSLHGVERAVYDKAGRLAVEAAYTGRSGPPRTMRRVDAVGREVERIDYDRAGGIQTRRQLTYDINGNLTESMTWSGEGEVTRRYTYAFDEAGNWVKRVEATTGEAATRQSRADVVERTIVYAIEKPAAAPAQQADAGPLQSP